MELKFINYINRRLLITFLLLVTFSLLNLYSASRNVPGNIFEKQLLMYVIGIGIITIVILFDYRLWSQFGYYFYIFTVLLLITVLLAGKVSSGAQRWLSIGGLVFQPSELAKLSVLVALAKYFETREERDGFSLKELLVPLIMIGIPAGLIVLQPDLGTAVHIVLFGSALLIFVGIRLSTLLFLGGLGAVFMPVGWFFLKDYQRARILSFLNPKLDPLGTGYHVIQSKIAVGSGGLFGKGFLKGTQTQLRFLPEQHTDFVFATLSEEWGFIGAGITIILLLIFIYTCFEITSKAKDRFGYILSAGITLSLFIQIIINIAMVIGLLPVVGIPLPMFSYGRSALLVFLVEVALLINIDIRRRIFKEL